MQHARIYRPTKNVMQSGKVNTIKWCLEFCDADKRFIDPIMGWIGSADMYTSEVKLFFDDKEQAISYAENNKIVFEVFEPNEPKFKLNTYVKNFLPK